ncbi:MAG: metallophosphoesterase [Pseudomonadota bacterium]
MRHILLSLAVFCAACSDRDLADSRAQFVIDDLKAHHLAVKPWTSLAVRDAPSTFHFLVVSDRTGGMRAGVFADAIERAELLQPAFIMSVGDLIEGYDFPHGYKRDRQALEREWDRFDALLGGLKAPFFYTPGDHDFSSQLMADIWAERLGRSFYHFRYKDVLFLVINSELFERPEPAWHWKDYTQIFAKQQAEQLQYIKDVLQRHRHVRWTFVFMHKPFWRSQWVKPDNGSSQNKAGPWPRKYSIPPEWPQVEAQLDGRNYTLFAGHLHSYEADLAQTEKGYRHDKIALATTGGLSAMRGPDYGEFDHIVWITMTADGPVIGNVLTEGLLRQDVELPKQRPYWVK